MNDWQAAKNITRAIREVYIGDPGGLQLLDNEILQIEDERQEKLAKLNKIVASYEKIDARQWEVISRQKAKINRDYDEMMNEHWVNREKPKELTLEEIDGMELIEIDVPKHEYHANGKLKNYYCILANKLYVHRYDENGKRICTDLIKEGVL